MISTIHKIDKHLNLGRALKDTVIQPTQPRNPGLKKQDPTPHPQDLISYLCALTPWGFSISKMQNKSMCFRGLMGVLHR